MKLEKFDSCLKCSFYRKSFANNLYGYNAFGKIELKKKRELNDYCVLVRREIKLLACCPIRDGFPDTSKCVCKDCGKIFPSSESSIREVNLFLGKCFGICPECRTRRAAEWDKYHSCGRNVTPEGVCRTCGQILPGTPADVMADKLLKGDDII